MALTLAGTCPPSQRTCSRVSSCEEGVQTRHPHSLTALQGSHLDRREQSIGRDGPGAGEEPENGH